MRPLRMLAHVSLDGVIQGGGSPDEDRDGGFVHGGWVAPHADPAVGEAVVAAHGPRFDLVLGRRTYDIWAAWWPSQRNPMADSLNAATKHVATRRPDSLAWGPAETLGPDPVAGVRRLKAAEGPDLILWGSSTLAPALLAHGLADEILLFVYPALIGLGKRLFSAEAAPCGLALASSRAAPSGVLINVYRPAGPLRTGRFGGEA